MQKQKPRSSCTSSRMEHHRHTICRRDVNCICKICIASIIATLDLIPSSSSIHPSPPETPLYFSSSSTISTPESSKPINSNPRTDDSRLKIQKVKKTESLYGFMMNKCVMFLFFILILKSGFSFLTSTIMESKFSPELVTKLGQKSLRFRNVNEQLGFLNKEFQILVGDDLPKNPNWEIIQDGLILRPRCRLYESGIEQVSIWGWPLQTVALVRTESDSRSFTLLSGRVTEWSNGELNFSVRKVNTSWEQAKRSAYIWRLDENTWILEYKQRFVFDKTRPLWSVMEFLKFKMVRAFQWLWKSSDGNYLVPT